AFTRASIAGHLGAWQVAKELAMIRSLIGDLSDVPADYIRDVAGTKRFLERWTMDPKFRDAFADDAGPAMASLGITLRPEQVMPFIKQGSAAAFAQAIQDGDTDGVPLSALRYRAFMQEKLAHRTQMREEACVPGNPRMAAWRKRQMM